MRLILTLWIIIIDHPKGCNFVPQESNYESMIDKSVRNTVEVGSIKNA